jgi:multisubunit Na+/H+ antiporter MnhE subunit
VKRLVLSVVFLTIIYALTLASLDPWDVLIGAVLSASLLATFRRVTIGQHPAPLPHLAARILAFVPFAARLVYDITIGTWQVALVMVHLRPLGQGGVVRIPIEDRSHRGVAVTALVTTISPGSYFIDVDWERQEMIFHFLDASDPAAIRRQLSQFYERYQRQVFP